MQESYQQTLRQIVEKYGHAVCDDSARVRGLLQDYLGSRPGKFRQAIHVLLTALDAGVPRNLLGCQGREPIDGLMRRLARQLEDNTAITEDAARWAVETWAFALGLTATQATAMPMGGSVRNGPAELPSFDQTTFDNLPASESDLSPSSADRGDTDPWRQGQESVPVGVPDVWSDSERHLWPWLLGAVLVATSLSAIAIALLIHARGSLLQPQPQPRPTLAMPGVAAATSGGGRAIPSNVAKLTAPPTAADAGPHQAQTREGSKPAESPPVPGCQRRQDKAQIAKADIDSRAKSKSTPKPLIEPPAPAAAVAPFDGVMAEEYQNAWAKHLGQPRETTNSIDMKMVLIPAGEFMMGSRESPQELAEAYEDFLSESVSVQDEYPLHRVKIPRPFYLGACEVTVGQFRRFIEETNQKTDAEVAPEGGMGVLWKENHPSPLWGRDYSWRNPGFPQDDDHPVVNITRNDAIKFCQWLSQKEGKSYRLPTEAEWEYACRAGTTSRYCSGNGPERLSEHAWFKQLKRSSNASSDEHKSRHQRASEADDGKAAPVGTHGVGQKKPNAWGLFDMHGNVREWCSDRYDENYYRVSPEIAPPGGASKKSHGVLRGGAWDLDPFQARSAYRCSTPTNVCYYDAGFRVVASAAQSSHNESDK
jgi:formylglycine-generating enzyme required for sulfatase activity